MSLRSTFACCTALALANMGWAAKQGSYITCPSRTAHVVTYSVGDDEEDLSASVVPMPEYNHMCLGRETHHEHLGDVVHHDRRVCMGLNQDRTCAAANKSVLPLPRGTRCQDCFVGATTDFFYTLNVSRLQINHIGVGYRSTELHSELQVMGDRGHDKPHQGSISMFSKPHEFKIQILGKVIAHIKLSMPTQVYYNFDGRDGEHFDAGARFTVDMGENSIRYDHGKGWEHHRDKAKVTVQPIMEGDYNSQANLTVGFQSSLQIEVVNTMWYHVNVSSAAPMSLTSTGTSGADLVHTCASGGLKMDLEHEAALNISLFGKKVTQHWGPAADRHYENSTLFLKCKDVHPKKPILVV